MTHLRHLVLGLAICIASLNAFAATETYTVDATHSAALFKVEHVGISLVAGRFTGISGTIVRDLDDPTKSSVEVVIKTKSVNNHRRFSRRAIPYRRLARTTSRLAWDRKQPHRWQKQIRRCVPGPPG